MVEHALNAQESTQPRYILALDGGGMRGIIPAALIHQIAGRLAAMGDERPFAAHFDLIAGTSTGALLALALTAPIGRTRLKIDESGPYYAYREGVPTFWQRIRKVQADPIAIGTLPWGIDTASLEQLYLEHGTTIFTKNQGRLITQIFMDKYDEVPLENFLKATFGDVPLSDATIPTLIMAYDAQAGIPFSMSSANDHGFLFWEAARASSAAPTYFKPAYLYDHAEEQMRTLIDGGVVANNPSLYAYIEAKRLYPRASHYHILSLSTASADFSFKASGATGMVGWIDPAKGAPIHRVYATAQMQSVDQVASSIPELSYTRIHAPLAGEYKLDETSQGALESMVASAHEIFAQHQQTIDAYASMLAGRTHFDQLKLGPLDAERPMQSKALPPPPQREAAALSMVDSRLRRYQMNNSKEEK